MGHIAKGVCLEYDDRKRRAGPTTRSVRGDLAFRKQWTLDTHGVPRDPDFRSAP